MLTYVYMICACVGGAVVLGQIFLSVVAFGAGHRVRFGHQPRLGHHGAGARLARGAGPLRGGAAHRPSLAHRGGLAQKAGASAKPVLSAPAQGQVKAHPVHAPMRDHWAVGYLLGLFNFQGIVAGATVLGLAGLAASAAKIAPLLALLIASGAALVMMALVAMLLQFMVSMDQDGTVHIDEAVGHLGTVYLSIPPNSQGQGKITLKLQQRLMEFSAVTPQDTELSTGQQVIVIAVQKPAVMEVVSAAKYLRDIEALGEAPGAPS